MFDFFSSCGWSRSISRMRDCTWLARGSSAEFGDKFAQLGDFLLFGFVFMVGPLAHRGFGDDHHIVVARIDDDGFIVDVGDVGGDGVEEVAVVADDDQRAFVFVEEGLRAS